MLLHADDNTINLFLYKQQICCNFDHGRRVQPIPGFPQGWGFCFQDPSMESCANKSGLTIVSPNGNCYWSLNDYENNDIDDDTFKGMDLSLLYSHLGATKEEDLVIVDPSLLLLPQSPSIDTTTTNTTTLKHTNHESNISFKDDVTTTTTTNIREIGSRVYCRWPKNGNFYWGMITNVVMMDNNTTSKSPRYTVSWMKVLLSLCILQFLFKMISPTWSSLSPFLSLSRICYTNAHNICTYAYIFIYKCRWNLMMVILFKISENGQRGIFSTCTLKQSIMREQE